VEFNLWDLTNCYIASVITILLGYKLNFSSKILSLLLFHIFLIFIIDAFIPYSYMPDQNAYFWLANDYRNNITSSLFGNGSGVGNGYIGSLTVNTASMVLAYLPLPVFIASIKSLAYINYYLYLAVFCFLMCALKNPDIKSKMKYFYFLYPSLIFYTSSGTRDILVLLMMLTFLYALLVNLSIGIMLVSLVILLLIKPQNAVLLIVSTFFYCILKIKNKLFRRLTVVGFLLIMVALLEVFWGDIYHYRLAMFYEDTGLPATYLPTWSLADLYRVFFAPFFFDARNAMQILQSVENLCMVIVVYRLCRYFRRVGIEKTRFVVVNFFAMTSAVFYSLVVFNYGSITRYKFPFLVCWVLILLILVDKKMAETKILKIDKVCNS